MRNKRPKRFYRRVHRGFARWVLLVLFLFVFPLFAWSLSAAWIYSDLPPSSSPSSSSPSSPSSSSLSHSPLSHSSPPRSAASAAPVAPPWDAMRANGFPIGIGPGAHCRPAPICRLCDEMQLRNAASDVHETVTAYIARRMLFGVVTGDFDNYFRMDLALCTWLGHVPRDRLFVFTNNARAADGRHGTWVDTDGAPMSRRLNARMLRRTGYTVGWMRAQYRFFYALAHFAALLDTATYAETQWAIVIDDDTFVDLHVLTTRLRIRSDAKEKGKGDAKKKGKGDTKEKIEDVKEKGKGDTKETGKGDTKEKSEDLKEKDEGNAKEKDEGDAKEKDEGDAKEKGEGDAKEKGEGDAQEKDDDDVKEKDEGDAKEKDDDDAKEKDEGDVKEKDEGDAQEKDEGDAKAKGEGDAKAKGEGDAKAKGEGDAKTKGEDRAKAKGEDRAKTEGEDRAKTKGEDRAKAKGEDSAKAKGEDSAKTKGEDRAKAKGEDSAKTKGEDSAKAKGEDSAKAKGEDSAKTKGEDNAKAKGGGRAVYMSDRGWGGAGHVANAMALRRFAERGEALCVRRHLIGSRRPSDGALRRCVPQLGIRSERERALSHCQARRVGRRMLRGGVATLHAKRDVGGPRKLAMWRMRLYYQVVYHRNETAFEVLMRVGACAYGYSCKQKNCRRKEDAAAVQEYMWRSGNDSYVPLY